VKLEACRGGRGHLASWHEEKVSENSSTNIPEPRPLALSFLSGRMAFAGPWRMCRREGCLRMNEKLACAQPIARCSQRHWSKLSLKTLIALLLVVSASLVEAQTIQTLCSFNGLNGANPRAALALGNDGNFYGTTSDGGIGANGTVFKVTTNGTLTTLVSFDFTNGAAPYAGLTLGNDGNFYGTASEGGSGTYGTVFEVTTNGTLTVLASFNFTDGDYPLAGLTLGSDGSFYGTTFGGGTGGSGTVFRVTTNGTLTALVSFCGANGANPAAGLTLGNDGNFYGTTEHGGITNNPGDPTGRGTVFKLTTNGTLTTMFYFSYTTYASGESPVAALTLGADGNFYGTTAYGGTSGGDGTVFRLTADGTLSTLVSSEGEFEAGLALGTDGNFYGTTLVGGTANSAYPGGMGTVFKMTTNGTLTTLASFSGPNGAAPYAGLTLGNDGRFYGTTTAGGSGASGTVFFLLLPPTITVQAQSQTNNAGATATFLVSATSLQPMGYQWQKDGTNLVNGGNISGATTSTLILTSISDSDAASYSVIVSNSDGSVTTSNAVLTVIDPPLIRAQPTNLLVLTGTNVAFGVAVTGTAPLRYQWQFNGANMFNATSAVYSIPSVGTNNAGNYAVVVTNAAGSAASSNAALTVVLAPRSQTNYAGSTAAFTAAAFGPQSLNYQWQKNGTNLVEGGRLSGATNSTLTIASVSDADAASYSAVVSDVYGSVTTSNAVLTVIDPPLITAQPTNLLVLAGTNVAFGVAVTGTAPLRYQWQFNGANLFNATSAVYSIPSVGTNSAGYYAALVTNAAGSAASSNAALTVLLSPKSQTNYAGSTAAFTAAAFGPQSLNYQWQKNGTNLVQGGRLSGTTNSMLTIASVSDADAASYSAVVSDGTASATTSNAVLTVNGYLFIASQPQSQTVGLGSNLTFNVTVYGAPPFVFQWYFSGAPLGSPVTGTNVSFCTLTNVGTNQAGNYSVLVVNDYGSVTSSNAVLTVKAFPPSIGLQPLSRSVMAGTSASFSLSVSGTPPFHYQWRFNGTSLLNATNAAYVIQAVGATNTGNYSVVVTNLAGSVTSSNALLTVIVPPTLALQLSAGYPLLSLEGMLSSNFVVQYSANLAGTNWINLLSQTNLPSSPYLFLDPAGDGQRARFYRAFMQ